ncbi:Uncharacterized 50 kDa protein in type I retrotransposable element R1DM [Papilio machaon]|uniref:Uncharacterized 50 kDa protein in type I retrotransposable element R1DM n=1 Tax=Papilio machaon TaxID=76193 RepID=A0A0N1PIJ4_PAPMA|nr:Uncharacterized 50 kDa protein in type I retrotransposable element R1DM [Papilio machaon]
METNKTKKPVELEEVAKKELRVVLTRTPVPVARLSESDSDSATSFMSVASRAGSMESLYSGRSWGEGRGKKRPLEEGPEGSTRSPGKRKGRGRPPTTGEYVGLAAAKQAFLKAQEEEMKARAEAELLDSVAEARRTRSTLSPAYSPELVLGEPANPDGDTATSVLKRIGTSLEIVEKVANKSSNLKGTFVRALHDAVKAIKEDCTTLAQRTLSEETRALQEDNSRLRKELEAVKKQMQEVVEQMRNAPQAAQSRDIEEMEARIIRRFNARLEGLEPRLNPEPRIRPPLASSKKPSAAPTAATYKSASMAPVVPVAGPSRAVLAAPVAGPSRAAPAAPAAPVAGPSRVAPAAPAAPAASMPGPSRAATAALPAPGGPAKPKKKNKKKKKGPATVAKPQSATASAAPTRPANPDELQENWAWVRVGKNGKAEKATKGPTTSRAPQRRNTAAPAPRKLKAPQCSAVVITLTEGAVKKGLTYSAVLKEAKEKLDLQETIGVESVQFRRAVTGATIICVPGATSAPKADILAQKLQELYKDDTIKISRPEKSTDIRIDGLDDGTTIEEIKQCIVKKGECTADQVRVGQLRPNRSGMFSVWAYVPISAAKKLASGRFLVGWVAARVTVGRARDLHCYRCLEKGHVASRCAAEDRSRQCYKCGQEGHKAASCSSQPNCVLCVAAGKDAKHRLGSANCSAPKKPISRRSLVSHRSAAPPSGEQMEIAEAVTN